MRCGIRAVVSSHAAYVVTLLGIRGSSRNTSEHAPQRQETGRGNGSGDERFGRVVCLQPPASGTETGRAGLHRVRRVGQFAPVGTRVRGAVPAASARVSRGRDGHSAHRRVGAGDQRRGRGAPTGPADHGRTLATAVPRSPAGRSHRQLTGSPVPGRRG